MTYGITKPNMAASTAHCHTTRGSRYALDARKARIPLRRNTRAENRGVNPKTPIRTNSPNRLYGKIRAATTKDTMLPAMKNPARGAQSQRSFCPHNNQAAIERIDVELSM